MTEPVKRYNLRQSMPATATTFLPDVVVSATDYARLEQECERWKETAAGLDRQNDAIADELEAALKLLARCQEKLDPHRDAVLWGEVCDAFKGEP